MLEIENFKKSYGSHLVLEIVDAQFAPGIYWLKGKNGSGKSSLLRCIAGAASHRGNIRLRGISLRENPMAYRRQVNFAEAEPMYPEFLTGSELVAMFEQAKGNGSFPSSRLLAEMEMEGYIESPIGSYSSGMLKKLSLVLAFLGDPKWILLDEPLNTLDLNSLNTLYEWISRSTDENGTGFLLSSHQQLDFGLLESTVQLAIENKELIIK